MSDIERLVEEVKNELRKYEISGQGLDELFEPLIETCAKLSRTPEDFKTCISEAFDIMKRASKRIR